jgi:hypothetical protein
MPVDLSVLKEHIKGNVKFVYFRDGALHYQCADGYEFPVPVNDTGNTQGDSPTFLAEDKGIVFMRWIRKSMEAETALKESTED